MKMNFKKGFTLIELLVVVAIIAILSSVILVSTRTSRQKSNDAAVKSNLATVRSLAEIFFLDNGNTYLRPALPSPLDPPSICPNYNAAGTYMLAWNKNISDALTAAKNKGNGSSWCHNGSNSWAVAIGLNVDPTKSWCVDSKPSAQILNSVPSASFNASNLCN